MWVTLVFRGRSKRRCHGSRDCWALSRGSGAVSRCPRHAYARAGLGRSFSSSARSRPALSRAATTIDPPGTGTGVRPAGSPPALPYRTPPARPACPAAGAAGAHGATHPGPAPRHQQPPGGSGPAPAPRQQQRHGGTPADRRARPIRLLLPIGRLPRRDDVTRQGAAINAR